MVKAIVMFAMGSLMMASAANAETVKLATRNLSGENGEMIVDIKDACGLKAVSFAANGATVWLNEVVVAYRAPQVTRDRFVTNHVISHSSTAWLPLKKTGLCVRRFYLSIEQSGGATSPTPTVTVYGLK